MTQKNKISTMFRAIFLVLLTSFASSSFAQTISGSIHDATSSEAIPYANIALYSSSSHKIVNGSVSDIQGKFTVKGSKGKHYLIVSVVGYNKFTTDTFNLCNQEIRLDKILLQSSKNQLNEVVISAERSYIEYLPGKQVVNLKQDIATGGGKVTNVLKMVPAVEITPKGEISIRGNSDIKILINGQEPSYGVKAETILKQIPVSSVERIEVITNTSAKDDPEFAGGAINIILKENTEEGFHVALNAEAGLTPFRGNGGLTLNYGKGKTNTYVNYAYYQEKFIFDNEDKSTYTNTSTFIKESANKGKGDYQDNGHLVMGGFTYDINAKQRFNAEIMFNQYKDNWAYNSKNKYVFTNGLGKIESDLQNQSLDKIQFGNITLNYDYKGKNNSKLKVSSNISFGKINSNRSISEQENITQAIERNDIHSDAAFQLGDLSLDYEKKIKKKGLLELGFKSEIVRYKDDQTHKSLGNKAINYAFEQNRLAMYGIYTHTFGQFSTSIGVRPENYISKAKGSEFKQDITQNYPAIFPNVKFQYKVKNSKSLNTINLSYSKRIRRPDDEELDPAIDYSNPKHLRQGNIQLKPEFIHSVELGYNFMKGKTKLFTTLYATQVNNVIQEYTVLRNDNALFTTYRNHSQSQNIGIDLTLGFKALKGWEILPSASFMVSKYAEANETESPVNKLGQDWSIKMNNLIEINHANNLQVTLQYNGKSREAFTTRNAYYQVNLGYELEVFEGIGSISLSINDIFNSGGTETYTFTNKNLTSASTWKLNNRFVNLGLSVYIQ